MPDLYLGLLSSFIFCWQFVQQMSIAILVGLLLFLCGFLVVDCFEIWLVFADPFGEIYGFKMDFIVFGVDVLNFAIFADLF